MKIHHYINQLNRLKELWKKKEFKSAYDEIKILIESYPESARLHIMMSELIQLQKEGSGLEKPLETVKEHLELAAQLEPEIPEPFNELGYFTYAVEDDAKGAIEHFQKAYENNTRHLKETLVGLLKCYIELKDEQNYNSTIKLCDALFPEDYDIDDLKDEWDEMNSSDEEDHS